MVIGRLASVLSVCCALGLAAACGGNVHDNDDDDNDNDTTSGGTAGAGGRAETGGRTNTGGEAETGGNGVAGIEEPGGAAGMTNEGGTGGTQDTGGTGGMITEGGTGGTQDTGGTGGTQDTGGVAGTQDTGGTGGMITEGGTAGVMNGGNSAGTINDGGAGGAGGAADLCGDYCSEITNAGLDCAADYCGYCQLELAGACPTEWASFLQCSYDEDVTYTCLDDGLGDAYPDVPTPDSSGPCADEFCAFDCCFGLGTPGAHTASWCTCT